MSNEIKVVPLPAWRPRVGYFWVRKSPAYPWKIKEVTYDAGEYYISDLDLTYLLVQFNTHSDARFEISAEPLPQPAPDKFNN